MDPGPSNPEQGANVPVSLQNPARLTEVFYVETNNRNDMTKEEFFRATGCKSVSFGNHLFQTLDVQSKGLINVGDMMEGFAKLRSNNIDDRIRFVFSVFDRNGDGIISRHDLQDAIRASVLESGSEMNETEMNTLVKSLLQLFTSDGTDQVFLKDFASVLRNYPDLLEGMTFGSFGKIHTGAQIKDVRKAHAPLWMKDAFMWTQDNPQFVITYGLTISLLILAFLWMFLKFAGNCDDAELDLIDPLTGYTRDYLYDLSRRYGNVTITEDELRYSVFGFKMSKLDSITCRDARKRKLIGWSLPVAKACAQAMKVVFTLILFPVSRSLMTTLRETFLRRVFVFDDAIEYHKFLGRTGFWLSWIHTLCHVAGIINWGDSNRFKWWSWAFPDKRTQQNMKGVLRNPDGTPDLDGGRVQWDGTVKDGIPVMFLNIKNQPSYEDLIFSVVVLTGIIMITIYTIAALFAFDYPKKLKIFDPRPGEETGQTSPLRKLVLRIGRALRNFNNFWYTHQLFAIFYLALLIHPLPQLPDSHHEAGVNDTWMWVGIPVLVYLIERILRVQRKRRNTRVLGLELLPGNVIGLKMHRPKGLRYTPGQYVFINCPQISRYEWHPFTLTSCPGDSYLSVHIRKAGDWTSALYELGRSYLDMKATSSIEDSVSRPEGDISRYLVKPVVGEEVEVVERFPFDISVDGPFGAPAQNYSDYKVVVLIGAGIGVTPFASVLTDLLDALQSSACPHCGKTNPQHMRIPLLKAYFYWTVRSRSEASWFKHLLEAIAHKDTAGLLEININITGIKGAQDLRTMMLSLAQYENAMDDASDSHARAVTRFGRINWPTAFEKVIAEFPNETNIGVFYCGPNRLAKSLAELCREYSINNTKFNFMRESFG